MESLQCESSNSVVKNQPYSIHQASIRKHQIYPIQLLEKQLDVQNGTTHIKHHSQHVKIIAKSVFNHQKQHHNLTSTIIHVKPIYWLGSFLQTLEIVGEESSSFSIRKINSFPSSQYQIIFKDHRYILSSNFIGSKYHLRKDGITYLTIAFEVGCGSQCRSYNVYTLRDQNKWTTLGGIDKTQDLQILYSMSKNYEIIAKYTNLQPTINAQNGHPYLKFSRKHILPCVQNTIMCNLNGQKVFQLMKIQQQLYEVNLENNLSLQKIYAILIATFDFKIGIQ